MLQRQLFPECDTLCLIGYDGIDAEAAEWLERCEKRQLFLVACEPRIEHSRVFSYGAHTLMEQKIAANEIGWSAVMQPLEIRAKAEWAQMERHLRESHLAARLLLGRVADLGIRPFSHARQNWKRGGFVPLSSLKGALAGVPALVAGAGPSLEEALPTLSALSTKALLIGSGTALSLFGKRGIHPHLACALDERTPAVWMRSDSIACVQSQLNPEAMAEISGKKILVPGSGPLPWESWWLDREETFDTGCTVGTFATLVAAYLGCNPIVCVGMDLCYRGEVKYAEKEPQEKIELVRTQNRLGETVLTQRDWLMAARWHREFAAEHAERRWINTAQAGLDLGEHVETVSWKEACELLHPEVDAKQRLWAAIEAAPEIQLDVNKEMEWQKSLERLLLACQAKEKAAWDEEPVYRFYLAPLWHLWRPVFRRECKQAEDLEPFRRRFFVRALALLKSDSGSFL